MSRPDALDLAARSLKMPKRLKSKPLDAAARRHLPRSDFALPGHGSGPEGKGAGAYPIDTIGRARSALSRVAANGTPEEQARVRAAVHRKYPSIAEKSERRGRVYPHSSSPR